MIGFKCRCGCKVNNCNIMIIINMWIKLVI